MIHSRVRSTLVLACAAVAAACAQDSRFASPTAPTTLALESSGTAADAWTSLAGPAADGRFSATAARGGRKSVSGVGTIANLRGFCQPAAGEEHLSFVVQGVKVVTTDDTEFFLDAQETPMSGGCANLRNGTKVRVVASETPNADGSYTAESVTVVDQPGGRPPTPVAGEGVVAALKGECPALTMVVHGYPVMTTSSTAFEGGACESILPGTRVRVEGVLGGNSVVADRVEILPAR